MGVKMIRWRPWPPLQTRKFEVRLKVKKLEGLAGVNIDWINAAGPPGIDDARSPAPLPPPRFAMGIRWKGPKIALSTLRRNPAKRHITREECAAVIKKDDFVDGGGGGGGGSPVERNDVVLVQWDEDFQCVCNLSANKNNAFHPWEVVFSVLMSNGPKNKNSVLGSAVLNLAEFASKTEETEVQIPITLSSSVGTFEHRPSLFVMVSLSEFTPTQDPIESIPRPELPVTPAFQSVEIPSSEKDELSALKAGLRKVKIFTEYVSTRKAKKACHEERSEATSPAKSEESEYAYPLDFMVDNDDDGESEDDTKVRSSLSYSPLPYANFVGGPFYSNSRIHGDHEDWVYYSNRKSDVCYSRMDDNVVTPMPESSVLQNSKRRILNWRKRKLGFRSPKAKGEPLLKKYYGEEGGDDIDFDRRQLTSDESLAFWWQRTDEDSSAHPSSLSEFGEDHFAVGAWETKDVVSRDGHLKLQTQVFFASIDQRSERVGGEGACTALVAVIAYWLQNNFDLMPIRSQFDSLIRDGSLEWRNLCENETYRDCFPDRHFDLETVLQAEIRSLSSVHEKSFIGFFHPNVTEEKRFDFLDGAMSFDNIWEEISHAASSQSKDSEPQVYIVSWNDHFFVLKVEADAYYIIDTLGERLYEGCNQAYILKFDKDTVIQKVPSTCSSDPLTQENPASPMSQENPASPMSHENPASPRSHENPASPRSQKDPASPMSQENPASLMSQENPAGCQEQAAYPAIESQQEIQKEGFSGSEEEPGKIEEIEEETSVCFGKESCKEYIKSFLAAIPIGELLDDIKRGLIKSTPLHQRLQVEFHFTRLQQQQTPPNNSSMTEVVAQQQTPPINSSTTEVVDQQQTLPINSSMTEEVVAKQQTPPTSSEINSS